MIAAAIVQGLAGAVGTWLALKLSPKRPVLAAGIVAAAVPLVLGALAAARAGAARSSSDPLGGATYT